jgi:hypothetical protein
MVSEQLILKFRSVSKSASGKGQMVTVLSRGRNKIRTSSRWPQLTMW